VKNTIYPYSTLKGELELLISDVRIDGDLVGPDSVLASDRLLTLHGLETKTWDRLSFRMDVQAPPSALRLFEDQHGPLALTIVASCRPTNVRHGIRLERSPQDPSHWSGSAELSRASFREKATLQAILTGTIDSVPCRPVSFSDQWSLYFDPSESFRIAGSLAVKWCDFKAESAPPIAKQFPDASYVVEMDKSLPEILLNSSFEGLEPLLRDTKDRSPVEQALHDSTRMSIARSVWMALLNDSVAGIKPGDDNDDPTWPDREWQAEVLKRILPEIDTAKSEAELLRLTANEWRTHPGSALFLSRAEAAIGEFVGANKSLRKSTQTLMRKGIVS
jgi:hypothetical protein